MDPVVRRRWVQVFGLLIAAFAIFTLLSTVSYLFTWKADQSLLGDPDKMNPDVGVCNAAGKAGAQWSYLLMARWFGIGSYALVLTLGIIALRMIFGRRSFSVIKSVLLTITAAVLVSLVGGFVSGVMNAPYALGGGYGGDFGRTVIEWSRNLFGYPITGVFLAILIALWFICASTRFSKWFGGLAEESEKEPVLVADDEEKQKEDTEEPLKFLKFFKKPKSTKVINRNNSNAIEIKNNTLLNISKSFQVTAKGKRGSSINRINKQLHESSFDEEKFINEYNDILNIPGIEKYTKNKINKNKISKDKSKGNNEEDFFENDIYYLIKKGIFLQNNNNKRTPDVKASLELFFFKSNLVEKLENKINLLEKRMKTSKKLIINSSDIQYKIKNIIKKLSEGIIIKHYPKNSIISKINETGDECYFLLSGKISIIRPMEYRDIQMTIVDYFKYLKLLLNLDEIDLVLKSCFANQNILEIGTVYGINRLIRAYFQVLFQRELSKKNNTVTIKEIESFFNAYHFSFEDFQLSKDIIIEDIKNMNIAHFNLNMILFKYFSEKIAPSNEDIFMVKKYNILDSENEKKTYPFTIYKYEIFLLLYPGSFFGDVSLDPKIKKRNATIRAEEDCIVLSLSNSNYISLLYKENKKLKNFDLNLLCNKYFFNQISPIIFNKYYFPMFKDVEKIKKDIVYQQNEDVSSIFLLKEGIIKIEFYGTIKDINNLIKKIIENICVRNNKFKVNTEKLIELRKKYIYDQDLNNPLINDYYTQIDNKKKIKFELFFSNGYECLGLQEYCLNMKYITSGIVETNKATFFEIRKDDLFKILRSETEILPDYYKLVYLKLLSFIKRLHNLRNTVINKTLYKSKENPINFPEIQTEIISNNNKSTINLNIKEEILNSQKLKNTLNEKYSNLDIKSNTERIPFFKKIKRDSQKKLVSLCKYSLNKKKDLASNNSKVNLLKKEFIIYPPSKNNSFNKTFTVSNSDKNRYKNQILYKYNYIDAPTDMNKLNIDNTLINTKKGLISFNQIKKAIYKRYKERKRKEKLNIVKHIICIMDTENSFSFSNNFKNDKNISIIKKIIKGKNESENGSKYIKNSNSSQNIEFKEINSKNKDSKRALNTSMIYSSSIKKKNKKIENLILQMRKKYAIDSGANKFIYLKTKKIKNKLNNSMEERFPYSLRQSQNNIIKSIKDYYFNKKVKGYSSLIYPLNNKYINRQKTIKIKKNISSK